MALVLLQGSAASVPFYLHVFAAAEPNHACLVPGCQWQDRSTPPSWSADSEGCSMYALKGADNCTPKVDADVRACAGYLYDEREYEATLLTANNLVCSKGMPRAEFMTVVASMHVQVAANDSWIPSCLWASWLAVWLAVNWEIGSDEERGPVLPCYLTLTATLGPC